MRHMILHTFLALFCAARLGPSFVSFVFSLTRCRDLQVQHNSKRGIFSLLENIRTCSQLVLVESVENITYNLVLCVARLGPIFLVLYCNTTCRMFEFFMLRILIIRNTFRSILEEEKFLYKNIFLSVLDSS